MRAYDQAEAERINALGVRLRTGIDAAFEAHGVRGGTSGSGSLTNVLFTSDSPHDARASLDAMIDGGHITRLFHLGLLRHGVFCAPRLMLAVSTPMAESDIDSAIDAVGSTLEELKPVIEAERPALLA